ncbi:MAG: phosphotransferase family protein [Dehalococcoidia bacterium]|nr:MAG: phosphotransferase family protein [Dehalococcoidia bacterium]
MKADQLAAYLAHRLPDASGITVTNLSRIPGGASRETWSFDAAWDQAGNAVKRSFIARRDPTASLLESNNDLEFELYTALQGSGVPVPEPIWIERDGAWLERPFFIMSKLPGASDARALVTTPEWADMTPAIARQKAEILARIHQFDIARVPLLDRPPSAAAAAPYEIERWERTMRQDTLEPQPVLEMALSWLRRHVPPPPERLTVVHADYRTGNFLYDRSGITGILDWEMAHAGDPIEDLGWLMIKSWRWAGDDRVGGLCSRDEFIKMYEAAGGVKVDRDALKFWEVFSNFKFAIIFITGTKSIVEGKTADLLLALTAFINPGVEAELMGLIA